MHNLQIRIKRPPSSLRDLELIEAPKPTLTNGAFLAARCGWRSTRSCARPTPSRRTRRNPGSWYRRMAWAR